MTVNGKPSVSTPKALELRPVQDAVIAIAQRLRIIETALNILETSGSSRQAIATLQTQVATLQSQINLISGGIFEPQNPNLFFAGPVDGSADEPDFRLIDWVDLPAIEDLDLQSGLTGGELVLVETSGVKYRTTVQDIADLAPIGSGVSPGGGGVESVNGDYGPNVTLDAMDVFAIPGPDYVPSLASGIDGDEILVALKGSGYYNLTAQQIANLVEAGSFTYSTSAPANPTGGDRWFNPDDGICYTYIFNGVTGVWVEV